MSYNYHLLDVFTDHMFAGNPLAVFPDAEGIDPLLYQKIAGELNLSETVFVNRSTNSKTPSMRIFTPKEELPTAGHPTIGTAYLLARETRKTEITLLQQIGPIRVNIDYKNNLPDLITMHQPVPEFGPAFHDRAAIAKMLALAPDDLDDHPIQVVSCGNKVLFIPIRDASLLKRIKIQTHLLESLNEKIEAIQIYCFSINGVKGGDVQGRMFAPMLGIYEDPATGSANGPLACYLVKHNLIQMPVLSLQGFEMGRPSQLHLDVVMTGNNEIKSVKVGGKCKLVGKGELFLDQ